LIDFCIKRGIDKLLSEAYRPLVWFMKEIILKTKMLTKLMTGIFHAAAIQGNQMSIER
jgi:hypothetical protein